MASMQVKDFIKEQRTCSECGKKRTIDGYHNLNYRTLFGKLVVKSPRLNECICKTNKRISFSPVSLLLTERTSPELSSLEAKWVSLMSYGMTVKLLEEVLPINIGVSSVFNNAHKVANRLERELGKEYSGHLLIVVNINGKHYQNQIYLLLLALMVVMFTDEKAKIVKLAVLRSL